MGRVGLTSYSMMTTMSGMCEHCNSPAAERNFQSLAACFSEGVVRQLLRHVCPADAALSGFITTNDDGVVTITEAGLTRLALKNAKPRIVR
jgi:hypothetical protein